MKNFKLVLTFLFGAFMIFGGVMHFIKPAGYRSFIPGFLPADLIIYLSGIVEIVVGAGVFIPRYRSWATLGILVLMVLFLPLHIVDVFKENPAIGSHQAALIRLPVQFVFILWAWFINKK
jgi:uncharacterized membrane protein